MLANVLVVLLSFASKLAPIRIVVQVCENAGAFANPKGPSASELFWDFFKRHPFSENRPPLISIASGTVSGSSVQVAGSASDPDDSVAKVAVKLGTRAFKPAFLTHSFNQFVLY